jgi:hypothetical protein
MADMICHKVYELLMTILIRNNICTYEYHKVKVKFHDLTKGQLTQSPSEVNPFANITIQLES